MNGLSWPYKHLILAMKQRLTRLTLILALGSFTYLTSTSQVVINEVLLNTAFVELKNLSDTVVNVSQYYLVSEGTSRRVGSRFPLCGTGVSFDMEPGAFLLTDVISNYPASDGELAMFRNDGITDPTNIIDYVQWGSAGHAHEGIAIAGGVWQAGDYVNSVLDGGSLEYDGDGDLSSDWETVAVPSSCAENGQKCEANIALVEPDQDPFRICIGDENPEYFGFQFSGSTVQHRRVVVLDDQDLILGFSEDTENVVDLSGLTTEDTTGLHAVLLGYRGPIGLLAIGVHIDSLVGCYFVSDPVDIWAGFVEEGQLTAEYGDSIYNSLIYVCAGDQVSDSMTFRNSATAGLQAFIVVNPDNNTVVDISYDSLIIDFEEALNNTLIIRSLTFSDSLVGEIGGPDSAVHGVPCEFFASNEIIIQTDSCISSLREEFDISSLRPYPNPVNDLLVIPGLPDDTFVVIVYQSDGQIVIADRSLSGLHNNEYKVNTSDLQEGIYFVRSVGRNTSIVGTFVKKASR